MNINPLSSSSMCKLIADSTKANMQCSTLEDKKNILKPKGVIEWLVNFFTLGKVRTEKTEIDNEISNKLHKAISDAYHEQQNLIKDGKQSPFPQQIAFWAFGYNIVINRIKEFDRNIVTATVHDEKNCSESIILPQEYDATLTTFHLIEKFDLMYKACPVSKKMIADFENKNLMGCDFSGYRLRNVNFNNANLSGANFSYATMEEVIFDNADLSNVNFTGATFNDVSANKTNLSGAELTNTVVIALESEQAEFNNTMLKNVIAPKAFIDQAIQQGAILVEPASTGEAFDSTGSRKTRIS